MENQTQKTIELGYTLTDCYIGNANFNGQQKQYVVKINDELFNLIIGGFVNGPSDEGRYRTFYKVCDITEEQLATLKLIAEEYKSSIINWNKGTYNVWSRNLSSKEQQTVTDGCNAYIKVLMEVCEPKNKASEKRALKAASEFLKPFISKEDFKDCQRFIYMF